MSRIAADPRRSLESTVAAVADQRQERHTVVVWRGDHASLPSPSRGVYYFGPLPLHTYGLALGVGILVAARVGQRRWVARGHPATEFADVVIWVVVAGIVGARLCHVVSDFQLFTGDPWKIVAIWQGGLSIWGAVAGGAIAVGVLARRRNLDAADLVDSIAPAVALGQAEDVPSVVD